MPTDLEDVEIADVVLGLAERIGPILHGYRAETVANALSLIMGDLLAGLPRDRRPEAAGLIATRALTFAEKFAANQSPSDEVRH